jgi:hypothetical protein
MHKEETIKVDNKDRAEAAEVIVAAGTDKDLVAVHTLPGGQQ